MPSGSIPSSAIPIALGRKAALRTPTGVSAAFFLVKQTCVTTHHARSRPSLAAVTPPHENALASRPRPNYSPATCCTSDVNPPADLRRHDDEGAVRVSLFV